LEVVSKSGARIWLETGTRLIFGMGKPVAVQGIARDVTERRRLEAHLLQSQKMEAIGRLAGGVAHDFNNMLTVITGYSQWMLDELPPDSPMCESASEILLAANRAASLTNQLLVFSRNQVIQPIILDLNSLVAQVDQMLRRLIGENIELVTKMYSDLGLIQGDPGQIEQVILNLAVNARDAMPWGGRLTLETANVHIDEEHARTEVDCNPGAYVMLAVSDTGSGIEEEIKAHIFEPFFTTKAQGKGTGLGLSTVYGIVKQDGGHIRVESEPGVGTVFRIYFPRVGDHSLPQIVSRPKIRSRGTETILLVEDETALRRIVGEMLTRLGYTIVEAPDSRSAEKLAADYQKPIQLLLTDVVMPELGGRELALRLKAVHRELKVLFMSGYADDTIVQQGVLEAGAAYLQKPFTPDALASKIREVLDSAS
jgi:signal transduction histidine kinase/ActR/RegA family two-component response regulator